jgi:sec-independent protein translocase protein TatC
MEHEPEAPRPEVVDVEEEGGPIKSFLEHLEDLRWVLIKVIVSVIVAMAVCMSAAQVVVDFLTWPLLIAVPTLKLEWLNPIGGVVSTMKIALWAGLTVALPFVLFFIGEYIMPALKRQEKKYFLRAFIIGGGLFMAGVMMCYFLVLPISLKGLTAFNTWLGIESTIWRAEDYFQFVVMFMIGMGISFEFPVILLTLVRLGVVSHAFMVKGRKYFFVANLVLCAFITPDFISTFFMVIPVQILMEICILISAYWERQKRVAAAAAEAAVAVREADPAAPTD